MTHQHLGERRADAGLAGGGHRSDRLADRVAARTPIDRVVQRERRADEPGGGGERSPDGRQVVGGHSVPAEVGDHLDRHPRSTGSRCCRGERCDVIGPAQRVQQSVGGEGSHR
jgi:hypothetical protein